MLKPRYPGRHTMTTIEDARKARERKEDAARNAVAERVAAANANQLAEWKRAKAAGMLKGTMRVWIGTPDELSCPTCRYLHGQKVPFDAPFVTEDGRELMCPPACPLCRCTMGLTE
jgi:hypothetical protein